MRFLFLVLLLVLVSPVWAQGPLYDRAMKEYLGGHHAEALKLFEEARKVEDLPEYSLWIGWCQLRLGQMDASQAAFERVLSKKPGHPEALTGRGYLCLRLNRLTEAETAFRGALAGQKDNKDALAGLALVFFRREQPLESKKWAEQVIILDAHNQTMLDLLKKLEDDEAPEAPYPARSALQRPSQMQLNFRAGKNYFELAQNSGWKPFFVQGMNLGPALPGRFPSQFPQQRTLYLQWLQQMAQMGCNVVRVYTVLPPGFYQAFWEYHQNPANPPLWLVHGVWAEEPPANNYKDADYDREFTQEVRHVIDILHGQADLSRRPGHAFGSYTADVSPWVMAILLGREWEPYTVEGFNRLYPNLSYTGTYVSGKVGCSPMEAWMARLCDYTVNYEMEKYNAQRPISFTNWPTLDPLHHSSEASKAEITGLLAQRGESNPVRAREYDNDVEGITTANLLAGANFPAGLYASYHAYPYYPDFMVNQPEYRRAHSSYSGYLNELKSFYGDKPLLVAEYGVPSSRGNCHLQPQGLHHGGHSEVEQGQLDQRLTEEIWDAGCAGGILFAWIDEWFKKNWLVIDREIPLERNRLWLNALDAEQNYGMLAMRPGSQTSKTLTGQAREWSRPPLSQSDLGDFWLDSDEGFLYMRLDLKESLDWSQDQIFIGVNTIEPDLGEHCLPGKIATLELGLEYLLRFGGAQGAQLLVAHDYRPYIEVPGPKSLGSALVPNPQMYPRAVWQGQFDPIVVESNRARIGRDGTLFPSQRQEWGKLLAGSLDPSAKDYTSLADWHYQSETGRLEVRLPWGLLGVTDPSRRRVIFEPWEASSIDTRITDGFRFALARARAGKLSGGVVTTSTFAWPTWEKPTYHSEVKPSYYLMQRTFQKIGGKTR